MDFVSCEKTCFGKVSANAIMRNLSDDKISCPYLLTAGIKEILSDDKSF